MAFEEVAGLRWRVSAAIAPGHDDSCGDLGEWLLAGRLQNVREYVFSLASSRQ